MATNSQYLESKILTAPPHRLHLMLIDGAIRFGRQAEEALRASDAPAAAGPLMKALDIVGEMLVGVRQGATELNARMAKFYWFLFCRLSEAKIHSDLRPLAEALRLLEYERTTWQLACDKVGQSPTADALRHTESRVVAERPLSLEA
jgi:flagellar protein FliS